MQQQISKSTKLAEILELGKDCKSCGHCCSFGSGALVGDDIKNIADFLKLTEKELKEKYLEEIEKFNTKRLRPKLMRKKGLPYGNCIFLKGKRCTIHAVKPLECRIGNCNEHGEKLSLWFALNYYVNPNDPESIRQYEIFLRNNNTIEGGELKDLVKDKKRLQEILDFKDRMIK